MANLKDFKYKKIQIDRDNHLIIKDFLLPRVFHSASTKPNREVHKSNQGGWQSYSVDILHPSDDDPLKHIHDVAFSELSKLIENTPVREELSLNLRFQGWVNINYKNSFNIIHNHMPSDEEGSLFSILSGVYYLKCPEESGRIIFKSDRDYYSRWFKGDFDDVVDVKEGELLIFPPHANHFVEPNHSDDTRVSLAFNITIDQ